jgi:hypothetical protein
MSTATMPEYIGGPLCGDPVRHPGVPEVTIARPRIGQTHDGKGTYVYQRDDRDDFRLAADVGVTS